MNLKTMNEELVAYAVQKVGDIWRWRLYTAGGVVVRQGVERTQAGAEELAANAFWRGADLTAAAA